MYWRKCIITQIFSGMNKVFTNQSLTMFLFIMLNSRNTIHLIFFSHQQVSFHHLFFIVMFIYYKIEFD